MDLAECCFTFTETVGLLGTGTQDVHLDFHTAPELCMALLLSRLHTQTLQPNLAFDHVTRCDLAQ